jgi:hypothetical protein
MQQQRKQEVSHAGAQYTLAHHNRGLQRRRSHAGAGAVVPDVVGDASVALGLTHTSLSPLSSAPARSLPRAAVSTAAGRGSMPPRAPLPRSGGATHNARVLITVTAVCQDGMVRAAPASLRCLPPCSSSWRINDGDWWVAQEPGAPLVQEFELVRRHTCHAGAEPCLASAENHSCSRLCTLTLLLQWWAVLDVPCVCGRGCIGAGAAGDGLPQEPRLSVVAAGI